MSWLTKCQTNEATHLTNILLKISYRVDLYIGPASVDWSGLTASNEADLEDSVPGIKPEMRSQTFSKTIYVIVDVHMMSLMVYK